MIPLLDVKDLSVNFQTADRTVHAVKNISFSLQKGETLAIVGESGSGKSVTAHSILKLLPYPQATHPSGDIIFNDQSIINASEHQMMGIRGNQIGMIFQEPMTSLNPLHTIEKQVAEVLILHQGLSTLQAKPKVIELLTNVGIKDPEKRLTAYPHELSGGQRQRVMIAMAIANKPSMLIADEPTTALDVTVQAQVLHLIKNIQKEMQMGMLLISHDLGVVRHFSDRIAVMKDGEIVEAGDTETIFSTPEHPYTQHLINAGKNATPATVSDTTETIINTHHVKVYFPIKKGLFQKTVDHVKAVDDISFSIVKGTSLGIVGESGSGKTTLAMAILQLNQSQGDIVFLGNSLQQLNKNDLLSTRRRMQIVFQDPFGSLSPRMSILQIIEEGLKVHTKLNKNERETTVIQALEEVGIDPATRHRYPHEFSGGQRQRISIARALVLKPEFIVLDEPTSALDRTIQFQVLDLLKALQKKHGITYLFISHDLKVIKALCHDILVMKDGKIVESGPADQIFKQPESEYTKTLLNSAFEF